MIIVRELQSNPIKIPNNLEKQSNVIRLRNLETKKRYELEFTDENISGNWYVFDRHLDLPVGEYEYNLDGNIGLMRICNDMEKKVFDEEISFKSYDSTDK